MHKLLQRNVGLNCTLGRSGANGSQLQLLVTDNSVPSSLILVTMMMEAIRSSEMSVLTRATRRHIPEDGIMLSASVYAGLERKCLKCLNELDNTEVTPPHMPVHSHVVHRTLSTATCSSQDPFYSYM
jgi:hypothetical protein